MPSSSPVTPQGACAQFWTLGTGFVSACCRHLAAGALDMGTILAADDLSPEMFVAVHSLRRPTLVARCRGPQIVDIHEAPPATPVPPGLPLQVLGLSLPFVACSVLEPGGYFGGPVIVDLRAVRLTRLSPDFVAAVQAFEPAAASDDDEPSLF